MISINQDSLRCKIKENNIDFTRVTVNYFLNNPNESYRQLAKGRIDTGQSILQ